jgi:hypothetical protein
MKTLSPVSNFGYVIDDMPIKSISKNARRRETIAMEEAGPKLLLPRNSAITISFFYCMANHATEQTH